MKNIDWYKFPDEIFNKAKTMKEAVNSSGTIEYISNGDQTAIINNLEETNEVVEALSQEAISQNIKLFTKGEIFLLILIGVGCAISIIIIRNHIKRRRLVRNDYIADIVKGAV